MLLIAASGEPQKKIYVRDRARENARYNYRYQHDREFRKYRCKLALTRYYRLKEAKKAEASP